jgi:hypothetical protein
MASTKWTCSVDSNKTATLMCDMDDGIHAPYTVPVKLRGVCYSPCPMNGSNKYAPGIGDWYWDTFNVNSTTISGWQDLWARDWPNLDALNVNTLRVYCMLSRQLPEGGGVPKPWNSGHLFTHKNFLDKCWGAGVSPQSRRIKFVLVGIPMPDVMLWKDKYDEQPAAVKDYWINVLRETAQQVGQHPAVMGFTIQNEQDGASVCYDDPELADFWWGQVEAFAKIVKEVAPDKLVGMATHDDPNIPRKAVPYMERCAHIDYWGVNTYQTVNFDDVFGPYAQISGPALKPVILTEYGLPATTRRNPDDPGSIYDDATTAEKTAKVIGKVAPLAFTNPLSLGMYYFEYCDEWWNQPEAPNIYTWWSGPKNTGFPNGYWDNDGFGLYSIRRGPGLKPSDNPWDKDRNGPRKPIDVHTQRTATFATMANIFDAFADNLYVVNYGPGTLTKFVGPKDRAANPALKIAVGPSSFRTVSPWQVNGGPPWQVTENPTGPYLSDTNVTKLPAVIAFEPNYLTAVAY